MLRCQQILESAENVLGRVAAEDLALAVERIVAGESGSQSGAGGPQKEPDRVLDVPVDHALPRHLHPPPVERVGLLGPDTQDHLRLGLDFFLARVFFFFLLPLFF